MLQAEQGEVFAVVCDHLGMPKELLGQDGRVAWAATHSAWGRVVDVAREKGEGSARPVESPFRLLGQYHDEETGLCCTRFRYFDAVIGRWLSPDPLGIVGGKNLLAFDGAPTVEVDPLGLACDTTPTLWRGDKRTPGEVFEFGLRANGKGTNLLLHARGEGYASAFVGATPARGNAVNFLVEDGGHLYEIRGASGGRNVNAELGLDSPHPYEKEVAFLGGIPAQNIVSAQRFDPGGAKVGPVIPNPNYKP
jgi:RHS repeat-associated protein